MDLGSVCRCCLAEGCYKQLTNEYFHAGQNQIYSKMLLDTFNLTILEHSQVKQLICEICIGKIRDASTFREMVLASEETLTQMLLMKPDDITDNEISLKVESGSNDGFEDTVDDRFNDDFAWDVGDDKKTDDKGQIFLIKVEPKQEQKPQAEAKTVKITKKSSGNKKDAKVKQKSKTSVTRTIGKLPVKSNENERKPKSQTQIVSRENSLKLILNSNLCLFKSLKTRFGCFHCKETFMNMSELREHSKDHTYDKTLKARINCLKGMSYRNVEISSLSCKICEEKCENLEDLRTHLTDKHKIQFGSGDHFLIPYNLENGFKCVFCDQIFNSYTRLSIHMNSHYTNNVCEICGGSYINRLSLRMHVNAVHKEKKCSICPATFVSHYLRVKHMKKVHNTGQYKRYCLLCNKTFRYSYLLEEHRITDHGVKRPLCNCSQCGKTFLSPQNLKVHIRSVHVRERNHPCGICGMRFFTRCDQKRHERTHEDVRSFACGFCEGRFKAKDSWRRHLRRQHPHLRDPE